MTLLPLLIIVILSMLLLVILGIILYFTKEKFMTVSAAKTSFPTVSAQEKGFTNPPSLTILRASPDTPSTKIPSKLFETTKKVLDDISGDNRPYIISGDCQTINKNSLPRSFDSRKQWPHFIGEIRNQGRCGSCWAFASTSTLSDRFAILSNGVIANNKRTSDGLIQLDDQGIPITFGPIELSAQKIIVCQQNILKSNGEEIKGTIYNEACHGNSLINVWQYLRDKGTPTVNCVSYSLDGWGDSPTIKSIKEADALIPACTQQIGRDFASCTDGSPMKYLFRAINAYTIPGTPKQGGCPEQIMIEILKYGPVSTGYDVYSDFNAWNGIFPPVYKYDGESGLTGGHAVKVIGWGVYKRTEDPYYFKNLKLAKQKHESEKELEKAYDKYEGMEYWIVANSWGSDWGREGYFYIMKGVNMCQFESNVVCGEPDVLQYRDRDYPGIGTINMEAIHDLLPQGYDCYSEEEDQGNVCLPSVDHKGHSNPLGEVGWEEWIHTFVLPKVHHLPHYRGKEKNKTKDIDRLKDLGVDFGRNEFQHVEFLEENFG